MQKRKCQQHDSAVTEILGTMLLLLIALVIFSTVYFSVLSMPQKTPTPNANVAFSFNSDNITLSHLSGTSIDPESSISIIIDDTLILKKINEFQSWDDNNDKVWGFGEKLVINNTGITNLLTKNITVSLVDTHSNSLVLFGNYYQPPKYTPTVITQVNDLLFPQSGPTVDISAAGDFMLSNVTLYYRYSNDNTSWTSYNEFNTDSSHPWEWTFDFPNGFGWYEFYSIGRSDSTIELPPASADTMCQYTVAPVISDPIPPNGASGVELNTQLNITLSDGDGSLMDLTWYSNASGSWQQISINNSIGNGTYHCDTTPFTSGYETSFYWNVSVTDGTSTIDSGIYHFTTRKENNPPGLPTNEYPPDESISSLNPTLSWDCSDPDGDTLTYDVYFGTTSSPPKVVSNQSGDTYSSSAPNHDTTYYWKIVAWDQHGESTEGPIWEFTTEDMQILTVSFNPSDDSYIRQDSNSNYGDDNKIRVGFSYTRRGLISFDLSSLSGKSIISAELRLYKYDYEYSCYYTNPIGRTYNIHRIEDNWNENSVRWNNRPDYDNTVTDSDIVPYDYNWMTWNVTEDVQDFADGTHYNYGWLIKDDNEENCYSCSYFRSNEYSNSNYRPVLEVTYID